MTQHRRSSPLLLHIGRLVSEQLAPIYADAVYALRAQAAAADGWGPGDVGVRVSRTAELTPVEAAADQRLHFSMALEDIEAGVRLLRVTVDELLESCHRALALTTVRPAVQLCSSVGREGAAEWGGACEDAVVASGLCAKHYHAERRWRVAHGLPTRRTAA